MLKSHAPSEFVGILGWPVRHSLSPVMHNAAFRSLGLDWVYLYWPVPPQDLGAAVGGISALGAAGANVTMPHKETVIEYLDDLSGDARRAGAVNTIQRVGDRLIGHNTDVDGFNQLLIADAGFDPAGKSALILGAGGAARAAALALADLDVGDVVIAGRSDDRAKGVASLGSGRPIPWEEAEATAGKVDLVVNATPLGMKDENPVPSARWRQDQCVVDLVYAPPVTALTSAARAAGAEAWGGLGMLVHQAAASFRIWTGQAPSTEVMSASAVRAIT
jgi:shikimate dehydrogenase